uniref:prolyl 3-hydroxylase 1-like n=1 Tax=Pristiophorus japonicus TaxID=55135 RepID=UPI00398EE3E1
MNQLAKAAAAAQTFFVANPEHKEMKENLEKYRKMEGVKAEFFRDQEAQPHWVAYEEASKLYQVEQFPESIPSLEATVREYMTALAECQAQCEGPYEFKNYSYLEYQSHLYEAISDHYVQVLGCNQGCVNEVSTKPGQTISIDSFLPSLFNFLQYAYHKAGNYEKAVESSRTFLLFRPEDRGVRQNLAFYESKLTANRAAEILPREDMKWYIENSLLEKETLYYAMDTLGVPFNDPDSWTPTELIPQSIQQKLKAQREVEIKSATEIKTGQQAENETSVGNDWDINILKASSPLLSNLKVAMNSDQLNGSRRVLLDGVLSHEECMAIRSLTNAAADARESSRTHRSPHNPNEHLEGLTILKALKLARSGVVDRDGARLYYEASQRTRNIVENYFGAKSPLYHSFSHLMCRTALAGRQDGREDLSHQVHADNCLLDPEAIDCWREAATNTARDFSWGKFLLIQYWVSEKLSDNL